MLYSLLIVDDEREIVEFLCEICSQIDQYEIEIYVAHSGKEALEILHRTRIDVVLSDVRMPDIDGLQLWDNIQKELPKCKCIFLTGHRSFDALYEAVQSGHVRYLLKTESDDSIRTAVVESIKELESSMADRMQMDTAQRRMKQMLPLVQNELLYRLLDGLLTEADLKTALEEAEIFLDSDRLVSMVIGKTGKGVAEHKRVELLVLLDDMIAGYLPTHLYATNGVSHKAVYVWFIQGKEADIYDINQIRSAFEYTQEKMRCLLDVTISFAISSHSFPLIQTDKWAERLKRLLFSRVGFESGMMIESDADDHTLDARSDEQGTNTKKITLLKECMENQEKERFFELLYFLCNQMCSIKSRNDNLVLEIYYGISMIMLNYINQYTLTEKLAFRTALYKLTRADEHASWNDAAEYLIQLGMLIFEALEEDLHGNNAIVITTLKTYIHEHLNEDLSLMQLSSLVYLSTSYLSRLFKQNEGRKLSEYIQNQRIEAAKKALSNTNKRIVDIASDVGYDSPHSFSRVFKSITGFSPSDYRNNNHTLRWVKTDTE